MEDDEARIDGWYYLHDNRTLIWQGAAYTTVADLDESDVVRLYWPCEEGDREKQWTLLIEATVAGALSELVGSLREAWGLDDVTAVEYGRRINVDLTRSALWWATPESTETVHGCGVSTLEALAELARAIGWEPVKGGTGFATAVARLAEAGRV